MPTCKINKTRKQITEDIDAELKKSSFYDVKKGNIQQLPDDYDGEAIVSMKWTDHYDSFPYPKLVPVLSTLDSRYGQTVLIGIMGVGDGVTEFHFSVKCKK